MTKEEKFILLGDVHIGVRNQHFNRYIVRWFNEVLFPYMSKYNIRHIVQLGDLFEKRKIVDVEYLSEAKLKIFDRMQELGISMDIIIGNHDCRFTNTNRVNTPSITLSEYSNIRVYSVPTKISLYDKDFLYIPWITEDNVEQTMRLVRENPSTVAFGHFEFVGFDMARNMKAKHGTEPVTFSALRHVYSGHFHIRQTEGNITYINTPYQMTWGESGEQKGFSVYDCETDTTEYVVNDTDYDTHIKIFYDEDCRIDTNITDKWVRVYITNKKDQNAYDEWIAKQYLKNPYELIIIEQPIIISDSRLDENTTEERTTIDIIRDCIDTMEIDYDKDEIKKMIGELHIQALSDGNL